MRRSAVCLVCFCVPAIATLFQAAAATAAEDEKKPEQIILAEGKIKLDVPSNWKKEKPRTRIVDFEFSIPAVEDDNDEPQ